MSAQRQRKTGEEAEAIQVPPHSIEAEQGVLGCLLLSPQEAHEQCVAVAGDATDWFYDPRHQAVFNAVDGLIRSGKTPDMLMVGARLQEDGCLEEIGGHVYLNVLIDTVPSAANLRHYLDTVWARYQRRLVIRRALQLRQQAFEVRDEDVPEFLGSAEQALMDVPHGTGSQATPTRKLIQRTVDELERYTAGFGVMRGIPSGYFYLDKVFKGFAGPGLYVIGARPGTGKTSLGMNIAERVATPRKDKDGNTIPTAGVGVFSLEMSAEDLMLRMVCARAGVNFHRLSTGGMAKEEVMVPRVVQALQDLADAPIWIDETPKLTVHDIRSRMRRLVRKHGVRLIIIDYIQLIQLPREFVADRVNGFGWVSGELLAASKELGVPIIILSQLNRASERDKRRRPQMADLRESGAIEQDAQFIMILYRHYNSPDEEDEERERIRQNPMGNHECEVLGEVCKNRNGPSNTGVKFNFRRWCMKFDDVQRDYNPMKNLPENPRSAIDEEEQRRLYEASAAEIMAD